jgi:SAM-dependent methyltransferase
VATDYEDHNRRFWDVDADAYQSIHGGHLAGRPRAWGVWRVPEDEVGALGEVRDRDVLELGCGAAQWTGALADAGARAVGLDLSASQLRHGAQRTDRLVQASAVATPFRDASFDVVFCDHGAMSFCDPALTVPEAARLLRSGGRLVFCAATPLHFVCDDGRSVTRKLHQDYFGMRRFDWSGEGTIDFQLTYGDWIRLFRRHGFEIEDLIELQAPKGATTTYTEFVDAKWARRWPAEQIWKVRRG